MGPAIFVGMDVSQDTVDVAVQPGTAFQIPHDESGITQAVDRRVRGSHTPQRRQ